MNKRIGMIIGEGLVFFLILIFGLWRIIRSIKKEQELARRQHNFLLSVTHELKTPLASTKLYLQTLLKHNFEAEKRDELLHKTLTENKRLEEIVDAILISARIENRTMEIHQEKIDVNREIRTIIEEFEKKWNKQFIDFQSTKQPILESDLFIFRTICRNLLENAIKYAGTDDQILISVLQEEKLCIRFIDKGPGIPSDMQQQIFKKFVRLENEETRTKKGTGLGLFIVKEFARLSNAQISYRANKPKGSIFELTY